MAAEDPGATPRHGGTAKDPEPPGAPTAAERASGVTRVHDDVVWEWLPGADAWTRLWGVPPAPVKEPEPDPAPQTPPSVPTRVRAPARVPAIDAATARARSLLARAQPTERRRGR